MALAVWNSEVGSHDLVILVEAPVDWDPSFGARIAAIVASEASVSVTAVRRVEPGFIIKTTSGKINRPANLAKYEASRG